MTMPNMILINISNHASINWEEKQKEKFYSIINIPFPVVSAVADEHEVGRLALEIEQKIIDIVEQIHKKTFIYFYIAGEGSLVYCLQNILKESTTRYFEGRSIFLAFASTARDMMMIDGRRSYKFKFSAWRIYLLSPILATSSSDRYAE